MHEETETWRQDLDFAVNKEIMGNYVWGYDMDRTG
jgi:hypothetical protein